MYMVKRAGVVDLFFCLFAVISDVVGGGGAGLTWQDCCALGASVCARPTTRDGERGDRGAANRHDGLDQGVMLFRYGDREDRSGSQTKHLEATWQRDPCELSRARYDHGSANPAYLIPLLLSTAR